MRLNGFPSPARALDFVLMARRESRSGEDRERQYEYSIPSRDEICGEMERAGKPLTLEALGRRFGIRSDSHLRALENRLRAMVRDAQLIRNRAGEYLLLHHLDLVTGVVLAHRDGYGFLRPDDGNEDVYLPARQMRALWDGDRVAARASSDRQGRREGRVVRILERGRQTLVGQFQTERGIDYVVQEGELRTKVLIARGGRNGARSGDLVHVEIVQHPTENSLPIGRVTKVVGRFDEPGIETEVAILAHGIPNGWPEAVSAAASRLPAYVSSRAKRNREDLRKVPLVTIDGEDAKDFDDAVYAEPHDEGWKLIVAIADVSHYVEADSALDQEARARGTSVYFPDRVVPMLPEALSNGLCSLNPNVDRLCFCCEMIVSKHGSVKRSRFFSAVMRSAARLTYEGSAALLESPRPRGRDAKIKPQLEHLLDVYRAFRRARRRRGSLDFDLPETKIELNAYGKVEAIHPVERLDTHRLIEECMIAANVEAAKKIAKAKLPSLYRVHEGPDAERLEELTLVLRSFGFKVQPTKLTPKQLADIIERVAGTPEAELVETVVLRSLKQARYQPRNIGHFGLGLTGYAHFTSPIRRYPDLLVHRALKWIAEKGTVKGYPYSMPQMEQLGEHCSRTERRADEAVWDVEEQLKCIYMKERVGEEFRSIVSSVVPFGLFVRVPELKIDGLVHVTALPRDYYRRDPSGTKLVGERTGMVYGLTDTLHVQLSNVNIEERKIDFVPIDPDAVDAMSGNDAPLRAKGRAGADGKRGARRATARGGNRQNEPAAREGQDEPVSTTERSGKTEGRGRRSRARGAGR